MHEVFISYSHKDKQYATIVLNILEQRGIKCWIDYRDALVGDNYAGSIVRAIKSCRFFVLLLSSNSDASSHVLNEINSAVKACVTIIPFKIDGTELSESMEYYLGKTHWLEALTPPVEAHVAELATIIERYGMKAEPAKQQKISVPAQIHQPESKPANRQCRMVKYEELLELGYTASDIAIQLVENDYINCNGISEQNEGTASQWEEFLQNNTETFQYLIDSDNHIIGDWSIVALDDDSFDMAMRGQLLEENIGMENTNMICFPGIYHGYILAISLLPQNRSIKNYNLLIDSFLRQLEAFSEEGIYFDKWCMNVFGAEVESLIRQLGFRKVCENRVMGMIYACDFIPLPELPLLKKYKNLVENYGQL